MYFLCVNVYCHRVTTQLQLVNISISIFHSHVGNFHEGDISVEKEAGFEAKYLPPNCTKLKNECSCTDTTPVRLPVADRDNFILPHRISCYKSKPSYIS
jgi:hypothetical protein